MAMTGRMEHQLKNEARAAQLLDGLPQIVTDYYYYLAMNHEAATNAEYICKIRKFLIWLNPDPMQIDFGKLTEGDITRYLTSIRTREDTHGNKVQTRYATQKQNFAILRSFCEYLAQMRITDRNLMQYMHAPRNRDEVSHVKITAENAHNMIVATDVGAGSERAKNRQKKWAERDKAIMMLFLNTGMRKTALSEINVDDINGNILHVIDKRSKVHVYKLNATTMEAINAWLVKRIQLLDGVDCQALFISNQRKRIGKDAIDGIVAKYSKESLGESVSPHKLRSAYITIMYEQTHDIEAVRRAVKHSEVTTTQRYIVDDGSYMDEVSATIEAALNTGSGN